MNDKITLEGKLFVLVEETEDKEDVSICAEVGGINLWDWMRAHEDMNIKITMEILEDQ